MKKMNQKNIIYGIGIAVLIGIAILVISGGGGENSDNASKYSASALAATERSFDFQQVKMQNGKVFHDFTVRNGGEEPIKIEKVYTSCMCTTAQIIDSDGRKRGTFGMPGHGLPLRTNVSVAPGKTITVKAIFDPAAHGPSGVGLAERSIYLETNSVKSPKFELRFRAMVTNTPLN